MKDGVDHHNDKKRDAAAYNSATRFAEDKKPREPQALTFKKNQETAHHLVPPLKIAIQQQQTHNCEIPVFRRFFARVLKPLNASMMMATDTSSPEAFGKSWFVPILQAILFLACALLPFLLLPSRFSSWFRRMVPSPVVALFASPLRSKPEILYPLYPE